VPAGAPRLAFAALLLFWGSALLLFLGSALPLFLESALPLFLGSALPLLAPGHRARCAHKPAGQLGNLLLTLRGVLRRVPIPFRFRPV
jgi:hypothetical protein